MKICFLTHNLEQDNGAGVFSSRLIEGVRPMFEEIRKIFINCDIIHALDAFPYGVIAVFFSFGLRKKIIITAVGTGAIGRLYNPYYAWLLKYAYKKADKVVAISNFTKKEILKKVRGMDIEVITHGVDFEKFQERARPNVLNPYILSVGAIRWRRGYKFSLQAFVEISKKMPDLKYVIIGKKFSEEYLSKLQRQIKDLGLGNKVFIFTDVSEEEIREFYRGAELFCLLSQNVRHDVEGFGLVFLEAAAAGLPVVGAKDSGVEDAVLDGENGLLVPPQDIRGFSDAVIKILSDITLRQKMSLKSIEFAKKSGWDEKIKKYSELYGSI